VKRTSGLILSTGLRIGISIRPDGTAARHIASLFDF
jgi:hypothetical protein